MGNIKTPLKGITTTSTYEEGEMFSLVNLRPMNGALHPVAPRKVMQELSQKYDIVFVHQNRGEYENWIGIMNNERSPSIYWDILSDNPDPIQSYHGINEKINSIEQIGNTLSLITDSNIYYLLFQDGKYSFLGELPQLPVINFKTSDQMSSMQYYFSNEYGSGTVKPDNFIDATKGLVNKAMDLLMNGGTVNGKPIDGLGLQLFDAHFVRYAFRLYDGTLTKHSAPILIMPIRPIVGNEEENNTDSIKSISYEFTGGSLTSNSKIDIHGFRVAMTYDFEQLGNDRYEKWEDLIKSVDIFMSQPLGLSSIENIRKDMPTSTPKSISFNLIKGMSPEALKNIENTSTFYLVRSVDLGKKVLGIEAENPFDFLPSTESDFSKMENLIFQEVMSDDQFSHHKQGAGVSYAYNSRLHLANIKTTFFRGFNPEYFLWHNTHTQFPIKNEDGEIVGWEDNTQGNYNGYLYKDAPDTVYRTLMFEFDIFVGSALERVYSSYSGVYLGNTYRVFMSPFISYPDPRAHRVTLYGIDHEGKWFKLFTTPMYKHNLLNIAFCVNEGLVPIVSSATPDPIPEKTNIYQDISLTENKIKVSELNNPIIFPAKNTYQAGNGSVLAMASNAIRISEGQFGQFPLYVFTTQGIYSLNVGEGEVVYSNISAPTSYEIPTSKIVASTPFGVVFTSARGVCIIRGQEVDLLTLPLQENPIKLNIQYREPMEGIILNYSKPMNEYLQNIDNLIYDPYENEIIISDKESEFNYILNLYSQSFYQSTERIDLVVGNTHPLLYVIGDNELKDYQHPSIDEDGKPTRVDVSFITRPIQFGTPYIKYVEEVMLFATLYDTDRLRYTVHAAREGVNFQFVNAKGPTERKEYTNLDQGRIPGNKFSYFLYTFGAKVAPESWIKFFDSIVKEEYPRRLTR